MARTNIVIDEKLINKVIEVTGARSKREAVDIALRRLVEKQSLYKSILRMGGKLEWKGDLSKLRKKRQ